MFEGIYEAIHREMDALEEKYSTGAQMSDKDLTFIDTMAHALKCLATYDAMVGECEKKSKPTSRYYRRY